jgi:hypothetical protein
MGMAARQVGVFIQFIFNHLWVSWLRLWLSATKSCSKTVAGSGMIVFGDALFLQDYNSDNQLKS